MRLRRTLALSLLANTFRVGSGLVTTKVMALQLGPPGVAVLGQFANLHGLMCVLSTCATSQGITRLTAQHGPDSSEFAQVVGTGLRVTLTASLVVGLGAALLSPWLAQSVLSDARFSPYVALAGFTLVFHGAGIVLLTILNGLQESGTYTRIGILQGLTSMAFAIVGALTGGLQGVLLGTGLAVPVGWLIAMVTVRRRAWFPKVSVRGRIDLPMARQFARYGLMSLASATAMPVALLHVRQRLMSGVGADEAGHWQAVWRISEILASLLVTLIGMYLIPRLAQAVDRRAYLVDVGRILGLAAVLYGAAAVVLLGATETVIRVLYSPAFGPMRDLLPAQLLADALRAGVLVLNTVVMVQARVRLQVFGEVAFATLFAALAERWIETQGVAGAQSAYLTTQVLWLGYAAWAASRALRSLPGSTPHKDSAPL